MIPRIDHPNDRPNFTRLDLGPVTLWYSYRTVIAFRADDLGMVVRENDWGPTTGKHLNAISDRDERIPGVEFEQQLDQVLARLRYEPEPTLDEIREEFIRELQTQ